MNISIDKAALTQYVASQLAHFFPDGNQHHNELTRIIPDSLERIDYCFSNIARKYYQEVDSKGKFTTCFNHLNSDHYASFLYVLSNEAWKNNKISLAEKLFYLNKALNGLDCFYSVNLPKIFMFVHPLGTVLGNADYQDYFVVYQNVTVGSTTKGKYPRFNQGCVLYAKSSVIGDCHLEENVIVGANASIIDANIESNKSVVGQYPDHKTVNTKINVVNDIFTDAGFVKA